MDENEIYEVLNSYKSALDAILGKLEILEQKQNELESTLFDEILNPAKEAFENDINERRYGEWHDKHGGSLDPYNDRLRSIEGADFDLSRQAFDGYNALPEEGRPSEDEYVTALIGKVEEQLSAIKAALGVDSVEAEAKPDGSVEVKADGVEVAGDGTDAAAGEAAGDGAGAEEALAEIGAGEVPTDPKELEAFEKELEAYKGGK